MLADSTWISTENSLIKDLLKNIKIHINTVIIFFLNFVKRIHNHYMIEILLKVHIGIIESLGVSEISTLILVSVLFYLLYNFAFYQSYFITTYNFISCCEKGLLSLLL